MVVVAAALVDLPVDSGSCLVMTLDAVHPEIVSLSTRVFCVNQGQGHKGATVAVPGGEHGQTAKTWRQLTVFKDWALFFVFQADFQAVHKEIAIVPEFFCPERHDRFRKVYQILDKLLRP